MANIENERADNSYSDTVTILHFNDVYNIEPRTQEPVGGASRFATVVHQMSHLDPMVLFSGDALNPSLMSSMLKGKQMIPILKGLGVKCAVYGNHDFDFGIDTLSKVATETGFPWLMSNVVDLTTDKPLADGLITYLLPWKGHKIGFIGLVEEEWIETLATIDPEDLLFMDFVEQGELLARQLRDEGADYVIALTHMRWPNDTKLAENVEGIDLILGGHDHDYILKQINGKYVVKSGTDFRHMSVITLQFPPATATTNSSAVKVTVDMKTIDSSIEEDPEIKAVVEQFMELMSSKMDTVIGELEVELDGRFSSIRTAETNLGNFITDIMLEISDADIALLNSGTLRSDTIHPRGEFRIKDLMAILPMIDPLVVIGLTGKQLMEALENGVCKYPALEGRFPQVAGISFGFDPTKPPGQRVDHRHVKVQGQFIELSKAYRLITKSYVAAGKDGYDVFKDCAVLRDEEDSPALTTAVQNHFKSVKILRGEKKCRSAHHQSIISVNRRRSLIRQVTLDDNSILSPSVSDCSTPITAPLNHDQQGSPWLTKREDSELDTSLNSSMRRCSVNAQGLFRAQTLRMRKSSIQTVELEATSAALAPAVEGRIYIVTDKNKSALNEAWEQAHPVEQSDVTGLHLGDLSPQLTTPVGLSP